MTAPTAAFCCAASRATCYVRLLLLLLLGRPRSSYTNKHDPFPNFLFNVCLKRMEGRKSLYSQCKKLHSIFLNLVSGKHQGKQCESVSNRMCATSRMTRLSRAPLTAWHCVGQCFGCVCVCHTVSSVCLSVCVCVSALHPDDGCASVRHGDGQKLTALLSSKQDFSY